MRVSFEQILRQNQLDRENFLRLDPAVQKALNAKIEILRTSRYREDQVPEVGSAERLIA